MSTIERTVDRAGGCLQNLQAGCWWTVLQILWMGLLLWGLLLGRNSLYLAQNGVSASGTVIENRESNGENGTTYSPVIEFTVDGQTYQFESDNSSSPPAYRVGQTVQIRYDPQDPERAQIDSIFEQWAAPVALMCGALVTALIVNVVMFIGFVRGKPMGDGDGD